MSSSKPPIPQDGLGAAVRRKGSFLATVRAVAWSFLGIRRSSAYADDVGKLNPIHVIIAGLLAAVCFVGGLIVLIKWVVGSGVAAG
ncbi:MAG: hypothetical protein RL722_799 [Pseudomonadota bacterium]|jgi:amino acid transporter